MLKRTVNLAKIEFSISPIDPLLIKSGQATVGGVDMSFVRTRRNNGKDEPFIPGSSLKGVIRSYAEKICRTLRVEPVPVCLPYVKPGAELKGEKQQASCGLRFKEHKKDRGLGKLSTSDIYRLSCPACRLFGSHDFTGRFRSADAYLQPDSNAVFEIRDGVAIDRITGGAASRAKYDLEVLVKGDFVTSIEISNFERWQLGLITLVLRDMEDELVRMGSGTSRGLGRIKAKITSFKVVYYGAAPSGLVGIGRLATDGEKTDYGFAPETGGEAPLAGAPELLGIRREYDITADWKNILAPAVNDLVEHVAAVQWPAGLNAYTGGQ